MDRSTREIRYGLYLRLSTATSRAQAEIQDLLKRQYGLKVAGALMPHATIKGFFKSSASVEEMIALIDPVMTDRDPVPVYSSGPFPFGKGVTVLKTESPRR